MSSLPSSVILNLQNARMKRIFTERVLWQPLLLVTQRKKGTKWNCSEFSVSSLPSEMEGKTVFLTIYEERSMETQKVEFSLSELLWFAPPKSTEKESKKGKKFAKNKTQSSSSMEGSNENENPNPSASMDFTGTNLANKGCLSCVVQSGTAHFPLTSVLRAHGRQVTRPHFVLAVVVDSQIIALSDKFHARSRWGIVPKDTEDVFKRIHALGKTPCNVDLIRKIDQIKSFWRGKAAFSFILEKASWLQYRLVDDIRPGLTLVQRCAQYHRTNKFQKNLQVIKEIQSYLDNLNDKGSSSSNEESSPISNPPSNVSTPESNSEGLALVPESFDLDTFIDLDDPNFSFLDSLTSFGEPIEQVVPPGPSLKKKRTFEEMYVDEISDPAVSSTQEEQEFFGTKKLKVEATDPSCDPFFFLDDFSNDVEFDINFFQSSSF